MAYGTGYTQGFEVGRQQRPTPGPDFGAMIGQGIGTGVGSAIGGFLEETLGKERRQKEMDFNLATKGFTSLKNAKKLGFDPELVGSISPPGTKELYFNPQDALKQKQLQEEMDRRRQQQKFEAIPIGQILPPGLVQDVPPNLPLGMVREYGPIFKMMGDQQRAQRQETLDRQKVEQFEAQQALNERRVSAYEESIRIMEERTQKPTAGEDAEARKQRAAKSAYLNLLKRGVFTSRPEAEEAAALGGIIIGKAFKPIPALNTLPLEEDQDIQQALARYPEAPKRGFLGFGAPQKVGPLPRPQSFAVSDTPPGVSAPRPAALQEPRPSPYRVGTIRKTKDGRTVRWDGKGWLLQP